MIYNIKPISFKADNRRLVPLSDYKGPILKLSAKDKERINILQKQITEKELDLYKLNLCKKQSSNNKNLYYYYCSKILDIHTEISYLLKKIKEIKVSRLEKLVNKCK